MPTPHLTRVNLGYICQAILANRAPRLLPKLCIFPTKNVCKPLHLVFTCSLGCCSPRYYLVGCFYHRPYISRLREKLKDLLPIAASNPLNYLPSNNNNNINLVTKSKDLLYSILKQTDPIWANGFNYHCTI